MQRTSPKNLPEPSTNYKSELNSMSACALMYHLSNNFDSGFSRETTTPTTVEGRSSFDPSDSDASTTSDKINEKNKSFTSTSTDSLTSQKKSADCKPMVIKEEKNLDSHKPKHKPSGETKTEAERLVGNKMVPENAFKPAMMMENPESIDEEANRMANMNFMNNFNPENLASLGLGVNPLLYMNPMLLGNSQLPVNPVIPSLANQIAANQLLANQMMLRQFLMSGAGQMYPQPPMMPSNPAFMATDATLQQMVAKRRQAPPNVNLFQPETDMSFHGEQNQVLLPGKRKNSPSSSNHLVKRPRVENSGEIPNGCRGESAKKLRIEEEVATKKKTKNNAKPAQNRMLADRLQTKRTPKKPISKAQTSQNKVESQHDDVNMSRQRRLVANARERTRVHTIGSAFEELRAQIPSYSCNQKLSKLAILRVACRYIKSLSILSGRETETSFEEGVEECTNVLQSESRARSRKKCNSAKPDSERKTPSKSSSKTFICDER